MTRFDQLLQVKQVIPWEAEPETCRFTYVGPQAAALGYPIEAWCEEGFWINGIHPDDRERTVTYCRAATQRSEDHDIEYRFLAADGRVVWFRDLVTVQFTPKGEKVLCGYLVDITQLKTTEEELRQTNRKLEQALRELRETQAQMMQQERLRALGEMASGIAHEFNNALSPILGYAEMLMAEPGLPDRVRHMLQLIHIGAEDAATIVGRLLDFARQPGDARLPGPLDLKELLLQVHELTRPKWRDEALRNGRSIEFAFHLQPTPPVMGRASELREAITGLVLNAIDAMPQGGTITIRLRREGDRALLQVGDTGLGMDEATRQRCFEPFFTTKGSTGTGLGLSMCRSIIDRHDGKIDVASTPGRGTTFSISLPLAKSTAARSQLAPCVEPMKLPHWRVLLVEDDPRVRRMLHELLHDWALQVDLAADGTEALALFRARPYDIVITDLAMPGQNGRQVTAAIKRLRPEVPVILITGWESPISDSQQRDEQPDFLLNKPIRRRALQQVLQTLRARLSQHDR